MTAEAATARCPDENVLVRFARGESDDGEVALVESHLDSCDDCRRAVAAAATDETLPSNHPGRVLPPGTRLGRYVVEKIVGVGGMGVVYVGHDEKLARRVALKLLHRGGDDASRARLVREAQAMARLSHPNVVNIYELGEDDDALFLVMELVDGVTLREWLAQPRTPAAVLERFLEAGRGLEAAHAAGVVHRDFKPANVLIGADGRARVTDFGLSRPLEGASASDAAPASPLVTQLGALVGTLAYMAPEQLRGEPADAKSDQFSFCVSLAEALGGSRPFDGPTRDARLLSFAAPATFGEAVPRAVRAVLTRGLAVDPAARFPSLGALLAALERASTPTKARWPALAAAAVVALGVVVLAMARPWAAGSPRVDLDALVITLEPGQAAKLPAASLGEVSSSDEDVATVTPSATGVTVRAGAVGAACVVVKDASGERRFTTLVGGAHGAPCADLDAGAPTLSAMPTPATSSLVVNVGEKTLVWIPGVTRIALGDDAIADVRVLEGSVLEVSGLSEGKTSLIMWTSDQSRSWVIDVVPRAARP